MLLLLKRQTVWCPTLAGWAVLSVIPFLPALWWCCCAEPFLAQSRPHPAATVLVVDGWIGLEGLECARNEFLGANYELLVAAGGPTTSPWEVTPSNYAEMAQRELLRLGVPADRLLAAPSTTLDNGRTHAMAVAVRDALRARGLAPAAVNIFTRGVHARRSRLVYAKVLKTVTAVGCTSWLSRAEIGRPWWHSSERSKDLINETVGYLFELLANSGRGIGP